MPPYAIPPFCIFVVVSTAHYFYVFLYRPILFNAMNNIVVRTPVKFILVSIYWFGVIVGISGMIYLGLKEVIRFVAPAYRPSDDTLGLFGSLLAVIAMVRLTKIGRLLAV